MPTIETGTLERIAAALEQIVAMLSVESAQTPTNERVRDFSAAASDAHMKPLAKRSQPTRAVPYEVLHAQLYSGQRTNLRGIPSVSVQRLLKGELCRVYTNLKRPYTQTEWNRHKAPWATAGIGMAHSLSMSWSEIMTALEEGVLSATTSGTSSGE